MLAQMAAIDEKLSQLLREHDEITGRCYRNGGER
jgi:hypothetical protein